MSRSIKISEEVYVELRQLQRPRETLSQIITRLLLAQKLLEKIRPHIAQEL